MQLLKQKRMFPCTVRRCGVYSMFAVYMYYICAI